MGGVDATTGAGLLHPVTDRHPFFARHFSVAVGLGELRAIQRADKDDAAPTRSCPMSCLGAPSTRAGAKNSDLPQ